VAAPKLVPVESTRSYGDLAEDEAGHRLVRHDEDLTLEAWGRGRADCVAEAVRALMETFAEPGAAVPLRTLTWTFHPRCDDELLVDVLAEALCQVEDHDRLPVDLELVDGQSGTVLVRFAVVPVALVTRIAELPAAIVADGAELHRVCGGWRCRAAIEVKAPWGL
jgi:SHS2 domain-containing protein